MLSFPVKYEHESIDSIRRKVYRIMNHTETVLDEQQIGAIHLDYVAAFRESMATFDASPSLIVNMDETPVFFDPIITTTFEPKGSKKVSVKKTSTTSKASALLAVSLSGKKLKPFVVFVAQSLAGKVMKETSEYDKRSVYGVGPAGFSDTRIMVQWIEFCHIESEGGGNYD